MSDHPLLLAFGRVYALFLDEDAAAETPVPNDVEECLRLLDELKVQLESYPEEGAASGALLMVRHNVETGIDARRQLESLRRQLSRIVQGDR